MNLSLSELLNKFREMRHRDHQHKKEERTFAIGSESMHDAGLTDEETSGNSTSRVPLRKDHYIKYNDLLPEEKINIKKKMKAPV